MGVWDAFSLLAVSPGVMTVPIAPMVAKRRRGAGLEVWGIHRPITPLTFAAWHSLTSHVLAFRQSRPPASIASLMKSIEQLAPSSPTFAAFE